MMKGKIGRKMISPKRDTLGYDVPYPLAPIAPDNAVVRVHVVEDGHLDRSPSTRWEGDYSSNHPRCFNKGGLNRGVVRGYRDWVDKAVIAV